MITAKRAMLLALSLAAVLGTAQAASAATVTQIMDNERFDVRRVEFAPGEKQAMLHPPPGTGQIATLANAGEVEVNLVTDGTPSTEKGHMEPGKVWWLSKTTLHQFANTGTAPYALIVVTFK